GPAGAAAAGDLAGPGAVRGGRAALHPGPPRVERARGRSVARARGEREAAGRAGRRGAARADRAPAQGAARGADLWRAPEDSAKRPVAPVVAPWLERPGFPLVSAQRIDRGGAALLVA